MTDLRQAAQMALEALEELQGGCTDSDDGTVEAITVWCPEVIDALRAALAEQQEPVAWLHWLHGPVRLFMNKDEAMMELERLNREYPVDSNARQMKPLYTAPQPRPEVELTDEEIDALPWGPSYDNPMTLTEGLREFARAVIKAYKSKQGEQI